MISFAVLHTQKPFDDRAAIYTAHDTQIVKVFYVQTPQIFTCVNCNNAIVLSDKYHFSMGLTVKKREEDLNQTKKTAHICIVTVMVNDS